MDSSSLDDSSDGGSGGGDGNDGDVIDKFNDSNKDEEMTSGQNHL